MPYRGVLIGAELIAAGHRSVNLPQGRRDRVTGIGVPVTGGHFDGTPMTLWVSHFVSRRTEIASSRAWHVQ